MALPKRPFSLPQLMLRPAMDTRFVRPSDAANIGAFIAWHRREFRLWWLEKPTPHGTTERIGGHPQADSHDGASQHAEGPTRIHGELLKLWIDVCQATVAKYMGRRREPPSRPGAHLGESNRPDRRGPISSSSRRQPTRDERFNEAPVARDRRDQTLRLARSAAHLHLLADHEGRLAAIRGKLLDHRGLTVMRYADLSPAYLSAEVGLLDAPATPTRAKTKARAEKRATKGQRAAKRERRQAKVVEIPKGIGS